MAGSRRTLSRPAASGLSRGSGIHQAKLVSQTALADARWWAIKIRTLPAQTHHHGAAPVLRGSSRAFDCRSCSSPSGRAAWATAWIGGADQCWRRRRSGLEPSSLSTVVLTWPVLRHSVTGDASSGRSNLREPEGGGGVRVRAGGAGGEVQAAPRRSNNPRGRPCAPRLVPPADLPRGAFPQPDDVFTLPPLSPPAPALAGLVIAGGGGAVHPGRRHGANRRRPTRRRPLAWIYGLKTRLSFPGACWSCSRTMRTSGDGRRRARVREKPLQALLRGGLRFRPSARRDPSSWCMTLDLLSRPSSPARMSLPADLRRPGPGRSARRCYGWSSSRAPAIRRGTRIILLHLRLRSLPRRQGPGAFGGRWRRMASRRSSMG
jgi:hypothetical protein